MNNFLPNKDSYGNNRPAGSFGGRSIDSINQKPAPAIKTYIKPQVLPSKPPKKSRFLKFFLILVVTAILLAGGALVFRLNGLGQKIFGKQNFTFFGDFAQLFSGDDQKLIGEDSGQINILLLGIGGEGHEGPYLTDTMMLAQIRPGINAVSLISIPRDYWVDLPQNFGKQKINAAFALGLGRGEEKDFTTGGEWARQQVEKLSGLNVPYFAVVDFSGFEKAINEVGGLDINVERTFTDAEYPNSSFGYLPPQTFTAGITHMDGKTALIFSRSRHGNNEEGSDFARGKRQKKIIEAFKEKALNLNIISDSGTLNRLLGIFANHFHTNLKPAEILHLYKLSKNGKLKEVVSESLDPSTGLVCDGKDEATGAYIVFICPGKKIKDITNFFKDSFITGRVTQEAARIWLGNSTNSQSLYSEADKLLKAAGAKVFEVGYSKDFLLNTVVHQVNPKPATTEYIKNTLKAIEAPAPPDDMKIDKSKVDIIVILGNDKN